MYNTSHPLHSSRVSSEEGVNTIISNDPLQRFSWIILLNDPLVTSSGCWWFVRRFFKYHRCIFSQKSHNVPWFILLSRQCLCNWEEYNSLRAVLHENDFELYLCNIPIRILHLLQKVDKFFTVEQERRSIDAWIVVNFFQPNTTDNFLSPRNCRVFFWINVYCFITITSFSFNIVMINSKLFSVLFLCFSSANR